MSSDNNNSNENNNMNTFNNLFGIHIVNIIDK